MAVSWCLFQWFFFVRKFGCFQKCWVSPTISIGWTLLKMIILGCEMGVPLFLETPIWLICCVWKFVWYCFCQTIWLIFFGRDLFDIVLLRNLFEHFLGSNLFDSFCQKSGAYDNVLYTVRLKLLRSCLALATPWLFFLHFYNTTKTQVFCRYAHAALIRSKVSICLPWIVTFLVYSLMHWSYPRDIRRLEKERPQSENDTTSV